MQSVPGEGGGVLDPPASVCVCVCVCAVDRGLETVDHGSWTVGFGLAVMCWTSTPGCETWRP
jgi:hypothetical protein